MELPTGRYCLIELYARVASAPADVVAGGEPASIEFDVSAAGWVHGTVLGPDGELVMGARVRIAEGPGDLGGVDPAESLDETREDGAFAVRVPGNREVEIQASHSLYRPAVQGGRLTVRQPGEGHVLRLEEGPTAVMRFNRELKGHTTWPYGSRVTVRLCRDGLDGPIAHEALVLPEGRTLTFGGYEPGTYTLWVDAIPFAPVVIEGVQLREGATDSGGIAVPEGSSVLVRVLVGEGDAIPEVRVSASRRSGPPYFRDVRGKTAELELRGLGPGRLEVRVSPVETAVPPLRQVVDVDRSNEVEVALDLR